MTSSFEAMPQPGPGRQHIQAYREGGFTIAGTRYSGSVLVLPDRTQGWTVAALAEVTLETLAPLLDADPRVEILVLGAGARFAPAPPGLREGLRQRGVVVEAMDTRAACRTYNVLLAEDRRVAAALIAL